MTAPEPDQVRAFLAALTPAARDHLSVSGGYQQRSIIAAACRDNDPATLAKRISAGITRTHPANAPALLMWRLRRAAGTDDEATDTTEREDAG